MPRWLKFLVKLQNPMMLWLLRSPLHGLVSGRYLILSVTGRRSGKVYHVPVRYTQQGNTLYIITSAEYIWWRNLQDGAPVEVQLSGKRYQGYAEAFREKALVAEAVQQAYPQLSAERAMQFAANKVSLRVTLPST
ncbi:MAG: nitroreductase/quinone reductase family protein [Anaerolineae bacterium]|nr:nitroreductase/quinone reductase family protein [Anaerolineae bacterium]